MLISPTKDTKCGYTDETKNAIVSRYQDLIAIIKGEYTCDSLNLEGLEIPITKSIKTSLDISKESKLLFEDSLNDFKFVGVWVEDNKDCKWRFVDNHDDKKYALNYTLSANVTINDVTKDSPEISIDITLIPDYKARILDWSNSNSVEFTEDDSPPTKWSQMGDMTWYDLSVQGLSTNMNKLGTITGTLTGNLQDNNGVLSQTLTGEISDNNGVVVFQVKFSYKRDSNTSITTYSFDSLQLKGGNVLSDNVGIYKEISDNNSLVGNKFTAEMEATIINLDVYEYKDLLALLVLSQSDKDFFNSIEFYNISDIETRTLHLLYAY